MDCTPTLSDSGRVWSAYPDDDAGRGVAGDDAAEPGLAPPPPVDPDPLRLQIDGDSFVVSRRAGSPGTYDITWTSHPDSYGYSVGGSADWRPTEAEMTEDIRGFLAEIDPATGYLRD